MTPGEKLVCTAALAVGLVGSGGCPSFVNLQTARALDKGQFELTQAASVAGLTHNGLAGNGGGAEPVVYVAARYGVADGIDVGLKFEPLVGFITSATLQLHHGNLFDLALTPDIGYFQFPGPVSYGTNISLEQLSIHPTYSIILFNLPLLVGINLPGEHQLVVGPRLSGWISLSETIYEAGSSSATTSTHDGLELFAGGGVGMSFKVGPKVRVMPEFDVMKPALWTGLGGAECGSISCAPYPTDGLIYQISFGITTGLGGFDNGGFL